MYDTVRYIQPLKYLTYDTEKAFDFIEEVSDYTIGFFFFDVAMRIVLPKGYSEPLFIPLYDLFL